MAVPQTVFQLALLLMPAFGLAGRVWAQDEQPTERRMYDGGYAGLGLPGWSSGSAYRSPSYAAYGGYPSASSYTRDYYGGGARSNLNLGEDLATALRYEHYYQQQRQLQQQLQLQQQQQQQQQQLLQQRMLAESFYSQQNGGMRNVASALHEPADYAAAAARYAAIHNSNTPSYALSRGGGGDSDALDHVRFPGSSAAYSLSGGVEMGGGAAYSGHYAGLFQPPQHFHYK